MPEVTGSRGRLTRYAWLSVAAALVTIALKTWAYKATGSVGLLSDALESLVNLGSALMAMLALRIAAQPADEGHPHGHDKAEYFSSGFEGAAILLTALLIASTGLLHIGKRLPSDPQLLGRAGGLLGRGVGTGLSIAVTSYVAVVLLVLMAIFGALVVTATPFNRIPARLAGGWRYLVGAPSDPALADEDNRLSVPAETGGGVVIRLAQRLIELRKERWELALYPVEDHEFRRPDSWADEYRRILELFERWLR